MLNSNEVGNQTPWFITFIDSDKKLSFYCIEIASSAINSVFSKLYFTSNFVVSPFKVGVAIFKKRELAV